VEKAGLIGLVQMHYLESDALDLSVDGATLAEALRQDKEHGLIPFWVIQSILLQILIHNFTIFILNTWI